MRPTDIEQPGTPSEPQAPVTPAPVQQPGQGDDFTKPGKKDEQAILMGRPGDEPIEQQNLTDDEEDDFELDEEEDGDNAAGPVKTH